MRQITCNRCKKDITEQRDRGDQFETFTVDDDEVIDLCSECGPLLWQFLQGHAVPAVK